MGAAIMLGTLFGLIILIFAILLRYDRRHVAPRVGRPADER